MIQPNNDIPETNQVRCNKVSFGSQKFADEHIKRLQLKSDRDNIPVRSYKCPKCGLWHLTSKAYFTQQQYDELIIKISKLEKIITDLQRQNKELKDSFSLTKKERKETVKDDVVKKMKLQNKKLRTKISSMRNDRNNLINTIVKLQNKMKTNE